MIVVTETLNNMTKASHNSESVHKCSVILFHHVAFVPSVWTEKLPVIWILWCCVRLECKTNKNAIARARQNESILHKSGRSKRFRRLLCRHYFCPSAFVTYLTLTLTFRWVTFSCQVASFHSLYSFSVMQMNRTFEASQQNVLNM